MTFNDIFGMTITNIYSKYELQNEWLDTVENFIELDNNLIIEIPYSATSKFDKCYVSELDSNAKSIFENLDDIPNYSIETTRNDTETETNGNYAASSFLANIKRLFYKRANNLKKTIKVFGMEYKENKLKFIKDRKIIDFLWYNDSTEKGFFLLDNGYLISEIYMSPQGTGRAGLHIYDSINDLTKRAGNDYERLSN